MKADDVTVTEQALLQEYRERTAAARNSISDAARASDPMALAEAQVHATLAQAAATMLNYF